MVNSFEVGGKNVLNLKRNHTQNLEMMMTGFRDMQQSEVDRMHTQILYQGTETLADNFQKARADKMVPNGWNMALIVSVYKN